jgi:hypothetical protein
MEERAHKILAIGILAFHIESNLGSTSLSLIKIIPSVYARIIAEKIGKVKTVSLI